MSQPQTAKRAPVKLIWMIVNLSLMICTLATFIIYTSATIGFTSRTLDNLLAQLPNILLIVMGVGLCAANGCVDLSLPGTACLAACLTGVFYTEAGLPLALAMGIAFGCCMFLSAIKGLFFIQSRRHVALVTAISSLAIGCLGTGISNLIVGGMAIRVSIDRFHVMGLSMNALFGIIAMVIALLLCFLGMIGGRRKYASNTGDPAVSGGARFAWSLVSGLLGTFTGFILVIRLGSFQPTIASNFNELHALPVMALAGVLIPNLRRTRAEALFGHLSLLFASIIHATVYFFLMFLGLPSFACLLIFSAFALLFLLFNLVIGGRTQISAGQAAPTAPAAGTTKPQPEREAPAFSGAKPERGISLEKTVAPDKPAAPRTEANDAAPRKATTLNKPASMDAPLPERQDDDLPYDAPAPVQKSAYRRPTIVPEPIMPEKPQPEPEDIAPMPGSDAPYEATVRLDTQPVTVENDLPTPSLFDAQEASDPFDIPEPTVDPGLFPKKASEAADLFGNAVPDTDAPDADDTPTIF